MIWYDFFTTVSCMKETATGSWSMATATPTSCWGCGRLARAGVATRASPAPFQICTLCIEEGCPPCAFCSPECLRAATPRHREFHREHRRLTQLAESVAARHWYSAAASAPVASPYDDLIGSMSGFGIAAPPITVTPAAPSQSDFMTAAIEYVAAVQRTMPSGGPGSQPLLSWAERAINAYALLSNTAELADMPRPAWWNDSALRAMSLQCLESRPDFVLAWRLRGEILSARLGDANWADCAPRSALELAEAGRCLQRAATFGSDEIAPADKAQVVRQAVACLKAAQAAHERESRESSGSSTPTGGSQREHSHHHANECM